MTTAAYVDATGIHAPSYSDVLASLVAQYQGIYGSDVVLTPDTQDGQWIGIIAKAISDANSLAVAVYNAFSPSSAQGTGLSSVVKINGIARMVPTNSTVDLLIGGTVGTVISGGYATDAAGNQWLLPATVTIPSAGQITATATAALAGAITASAGSITGIGTPTSGWQTVVNLAAAVAGSPVESDAALRQRQAISTELPSVTIAQGIEGAIAAISGVTVVKAYDNDTSGVDANGIPANSLSVVVEGGDAVAIATVTANKKTPGCGTFGNTSEVIVDSVSGIPKTISFMRATDVTIDVQVTLKALAGYTTVIGTQIQAAVAAFFSTFTPGDDVYVTKLFGPANLSGGTGSSTYNVLSVAISRDPATPTVADIAMAFNERAVCLTTNVYLTVS